MHPLHRSPRRRTAALSLLILLLATCAVPGVRGQAAPGAEPVIRVTPRYYNWTAPPGVPWTETNTGFDSLAWAIPLSQAAIVMVDVWERHYLEDTQARIETIVQEKIHPLVEAARAAGLRVIHTPGPRKAMHYPDHLWRPAAAPASEQRAARADAAEGDVWPPPDFRRRRGAYAAYGRPAAPPERRAQLQVIRTGNLIHPLVAPAPGEPVIRTGDDLHAYLKEHGILFLFYVGFHPNGCIITRDYGALQMGQRGYTVILLRDCGTAMEAAQTQARMEQTRNAYLMLEMFGKYTLTSDALVRGLPR